MHWAKRIFLGFYRISVLPKQKKIPIIPKTSTALKLCYFWPFDKEKDWLTCEKFGKLSWINSNWLVIIFGIFFYFSYFRCLCLYRICARVFDSCKYDWPRWFKAFNKLHNNVTSLSIFFCLFSFVCTWKLWQQIARAKNVAFHFSSP